MLAKRIIPCLDIKNGRVVKGVNFVNLRDAGDPVEQARIYDAEGADELVFLDITATAEARGTGDRAGPIRRPGPKKVSLNGAGVGEPELIARGAETFGSQAVVVAIDAKR